MKHITAQDENYQRLSGLARQLVHTGNPFPGSAFAGKFTYVFSYVNIAQARDSTSFHRLLSNYLAGKGQQHYYIAPVNRDMTLFNNGTIVRFDIGDSVALYQDFWDNPAEPGQEYLQFAEGLLVFNEQLDWFLFEDLRSLNLAMFALNKREGLESFLRCFGPEEVDFCDEADVKSAVEHAYTAEGRRLFSHWIQPHIVFIKD